MYLKIFNLNFAAFYCVKLFGSISFMILLFDAHDACLQPVNTYSHVTKTQASNVLSDFNTVFIVHHPFPKKHLPLKGWAK